MAKQLIKVDFKMFLDRKRVTNRLDRKNRRVLARTGGFGRSFMRRLIRKAPKKKKITEGPPRYHVRGFASLKDGIFFQFDGSSSVLIGPNKLNTNVKPSGKASSAQMLDEGGAGTITTRRGRFRARWKKRPFTTPAMAPTSDKMLELMKTIQL